jgi:hypothetical protein
LPDFLEVMPVSGGKVIQANNPLIKGEECLQEIGPDEPGNAGDKPCFRGRDEILFYFFNFSQFSSTFWLFPWFHASCRHNPSPAIILLIVNQNYDINQHKIQSTKSETNSNDQNSNC